MSLNFSDHKTASKYASQVNEVYSARLNELLGGVTWSSNMARDRKFHHRERLKANRRFHWGRDLRNEPKFLSQAVDTPKPCSCLMCGNARKHAGSTMQERRAELAEHDDEAT